MDSNISNSSKIEDKSFAAKITLQSKGKLFLLDEPKVMGILNLTPDSFFEGSRVQLDADVLHLKVKQMVDDGVDIIDIGGYSTRPGADEVTVEEECERTVWAVAFIKEKFPDHWISIDTFRAEVAKAAVHAGADIVNDISAGSLDPKMIEIVGRLGVPYIAMHMRGNPQTMQGLTQYEDILKEMLVFFQEKYQQCIQAGIRDVILDPGFGFAKTLEQNYWILKNLSYFKNIPIPILVGLSRKSMIYKKLGVSAEESLNGTTALHMVSLINGAQVLRVHDVLEAKQTIELYKQVYR
ncbi:dihydropteroate synthase [Mongoliitalea daihaiensis]|uniref:dihydropteroate synthase n=1 Tax=Mongoliitalea daihaiensis TaxID=2782006 RepID=UPI001F4803B3|nr:dihydropteroate synthase [Mongoliitalea daihaiensis]UJP63297.1 dihydropteroate synthase [Mongoliitalea daihaiensis]